VSGQKIKDEIITMLIDHSRIIYSVLSDMAVYYSGWAEGNKKNLEKKKSKMQLTEEDGDAIKIKIIKNYSEVGSQGLGDYVALVLQMDNVINSALEFVDYLAFINVEISDEIKKRYHKLINSLMEMGTALKTTIKNLRDNPDTAFANTTTIHEIENHIDGIFREFLQYIYDNNDLDLRLVLKIRDSIKILEELADRVHDIADQIRILLYI